MSRDDFSGWTTTQAGTAWRRAWWDRMLWRADVAATFGCSYVWEKP